VGSGDGWVMGDDFVAKSLIVRTVDRMRGAISSGQWKLRAQVKQTSIRALTTAYTSLYAGFAGHNTVASGVLG
jgi:hypothetical protein